MNNRALLSKNIFERRLTKMDKNRNITCDAYHCTYNDGHMNCTADGIKVGTQSACCCDDTRCATFKMKAENK